MNRNPLITRLAPLALAVTLALAGCSGSGDPQKMVESARDYMAQNDTPAAIIQLKNALQEKPDLPEARFLLGKALLSKGDVPGSEIELQKARDLGYATDEVTPLLVRSRIAQGQFKKVTDEFGKVQLTAPEANAELKTLLAVAWRQQNNEQGFETSLREALQANPDHAPALIEQARLQASKADFDAALATLGAVIAKDPKNADALKFRGDIELHGKRDSDRALTSYRASTEAQPNFGEGQASVVRLLLGQGKNDEAATEVEKLAKFAGGRPQTLYLQSQVAYQKGDFKEAQTRVQQLLKISPEISIGLELAGAIEYQMNSMVQAETLLSRALQSAPGLNVARRFLVLTYLRTGQVDRAMGALPADLDSKNLDAAMLSVAGQVFMVKGEFERAQQLFTRASQLDPNDPAKRTSVAISQLMLGKTDTALSSLQAIAAADDGVVADLALINAHMQRREVDQALVAIDAMQKKRANDPLPLQLRGRALLLRNDLPGARQAFTQAQTINPDYFAATAALAALDMAENKSADALKRLDTALQRDPKNFQALLVQAEILGRSGGAPDEVAKKIQQAVDAAPSEKMPRLMLVEQLLRRNDPKAALSAAQSAAAALPEVPEVVDALGRAQTAAGEYNQAMSTFGKLDGLLPNSPLPSLRRSMVNMASSDKPQAMQNLRKALEVRPDLLEAQRGLASLSLDAQQPAEALAISRTVQQQRPKEGVGYILEGDVHAAAKNWDRSADAYRAGLKAAPGPELAIKLHTALTLGGKATEADRFAADWTKSNPKDTALPLYLGDRAIATNKLADAQRLYDRVIALQPRNAVALNNQAWVAGQLGRADAVALAERANEVAPNQPAFMDTLAVLLSAKGDNARALDLQKKAVALQPNVPLFKLNLAKIHLKAGEKDAARTLLTEISALGDKFAGQAEVDKLKQGM
jgi:putative PEP-CTERM system TPR-repeat lipoprotein